MNKELKLNTVENVIKNQIFIIRGKKVMIDATLAELYSVSTMQLNQQIKRNSKRFPNDFMFQLTPEEKEEVITICDNLARLKFSPHLPYAFTEHGIAMLSSVLNSEIAVQMNIFIIRAFIKMRESMEKYKDLALKIDQLEINQLQDHAMIKNVHLVVKQLLEKPRIKKSGHKKVNNGTHRKLR